MTSADWPGRCVRERVGYEPRDLSLFRAALTHRSASGPNNERLEFLGDAVLNLAIAQRLYETFPQASEGDLSRLRARLVSREPLAEVARALRLGEEPHAQTFEVSCEVPELGRRVQGRGSSRRRAEQGAAERMLAEIETDARADRPA